eukprot:CAMPEP_0174738472 /NCGR_PEP_ID=MMETSP1094-20130205/70005_1 /TAXON_ID=156173 /ORGANISM="Chrysochromulina brevifilum, Strain UTEX LB 985" /LENGTH=52 /DNA_ID=CAMNT_0015941893 /DNA_START=26 /DNA_END=182 /DNA_ORIENTATION=-
MALSTAVMRRQSATMTVVRAAQMAHSEPDHRAPSVEAPLHAVDPQKRAPAGF